MGKERSGMNRREFLKQGTALGIGALMGPSLTKLGWAASKDRVTILHGIGIDSLNLYAHSASPTYGIWQHMMEPLIDIDYSKPDYIGHLAESWEFQGKKWVFHLKKGVRFHNGDLFTSKDVIFSINRMKNDKRSLQSSPVKDVVEMQPLDDHTVAIITEKPNAVFLDRIYNRYMMSKTAADKYGDQVDQYAIGTGPYRFMSWQRDGNLVMTRNEDYWGPKPDIKEVVYRKVGEEAGRVAGLIAGQGDVINNVPIEEIPRLERHPKVRIEKVEGQRMYFLAMNVTFKPFDNKLVRQAVNYSIDPQAVVKNIYEGNGFVMNGPMSSNVIGYDSKIKRYPFDPKKARELLAKAGYPNGVEVKLYFAPDRYPKAREVCQVLANQLAKGGIKADLVSQEFVVFWGNSGVNGGRLPFYYVGRPAIDADTVYDQYFRSGVTKRVNYKNPDVDRLIDEEQRTGDQKKRIALLQEIGRILMDDVPFAPLYTLAEVYGVARNISWKARPDEKILVADMKIRA
ncbi:MAG: ABC transporter substrate-binding protein [Candidatus Binatia bacterium]